jgi:hypothetical protein
VGSEALGLTWLVVAEDASIRIEAPGTPEDPIKVAVLDPRDSSGHTSDRDCRFGRAGAAGAAPEKRFFAVTKPERSIRVGTGGRAVIRVSLSARVHAR